MEGWSAAYWYRLSGEGAHVWGMVLLVVLAAVVLIILGIIIKGLGYLLAIGLIAILVALIVGAARYLRTQWRR